MDNRLLVLIDRAVLHSVPGITHEGGLLFERARHRHYLIRVKWYFCRGHVLGLSSSSMPCLSSLSSLDTSLTTFIIASFVQVDSLSTRNPILHVSTYISQKNNNRRSVVACRAARQAQTVLMCRVVLRAIMNAVGFHYLRNAMYHRRKHCAQYENKRYA